MNLWNLAKYLLEMVKRLPQNIKNSLFINSYMNNSDVVMELTRRKIYFSRKYFLIKEKLFFFLRAGVQALILYTLSCFLLYFAPMLTGEWIKQIFISFVFATNSVFCYFLLFIFHPKAFKEILFEDKPEQANKEYFILGILVKILCILEILMLLLKILLFPVFLENTIMTKFEGFVFFYFGITYIVYSILYLSARRSAVTISREDISSDILIHEISDVHQVNPDRQFIVEKSNGYLYISPIAPRRNQYYAVTPPPYQVPIKSITYIEAGTHRILYDFEKMNWICKN